jgi:hypothetical protein
MEETTHIWKQGTKVNLLLEVVSYNTHSYNLHEIFTFRKNELLKLNNIIQEYIGNWKQCLQKMDKETCRYYPHWERKKQEAKGWIA